MGNDKLEIPRDAILDGSNYVDWKMVVSSVLIQHDLQDFVFKETTPIPENSSKINNAKTFLLFSMNRDHRSKISHCSTPHEIWQAISSIYENKSKRAVNTLWKRLFNYKIASIDTINQGISEMQLIFSELKSRSIQVDNSCLIGVIESALPQEFNEWLVNWSMRDSEPSLNDLTSSIANHIEILKSHETKAMMASVGRETRPHTNIKKLCKYCKKSGHEINECRKLKRKRAEEAQSKSSSQAPAASQSHSQTQSQPMQMNFAMMALMSKVQRSEWLADSGSSLHLTNNLSWISDYTPLICPINIHLGDDRIIQAKGFGKVIVAGGVIRNVHYAPQIQANLFSLSSAADQGVEILTTNLKMSFIQNGVEIAQATRQGKIYVLKFDVIPSNSIICAAATLDEWHRRFGHVSTHSIQRLQCSGAVEGLDIKSKEAEICEDCSLNKCHKASHASRTTPKSNKPGQVIHLGTAGPYTPTGLDSIRFFVIAKDEFSGFRMVSCIPTKGHIPDEVKLMITRAEIETGSCPLKVFTDNGTEFINQHLSQFLRDRGCIHETSAARTPQQNGLIEREIRTTVECARTILNASKLPHKLWPEAIRAATYILNRSLPANRTKTPHELWYGYKPNVKNLRVFGQHAIVLKSSRQAKFEEKGEKLYFVGYSQNFNTFRLFDPVKQRVINSCDVQFISSYGYRQSSKQIQEISQWSAPVSLSNAPDQLSHNSGSIHRSSTPISPEEQTTLDTPFMSARKSPAHNPADLTHHANEDHVPITDRSMIQDHAPPTPPPRNEAQEPREHHASQPIYENLETRSLRPRKNLSYKSFFSLKTNHVANACISQDPDPITFAQAIERPDKNKWVEAMADEISSINKCGVWELVDRPNCNVISCRWVFKTKRDTEGNIVRHRARLVARGYTQKHGVDYFATYAPVCDTTTIRLLFAYAAHNRLLLRQFDVKAAFLHGDLEERVFMEQPPGFEHDDNKVYRLKKAIYGLKQAGRQWNIKFSSSLVEYGLKQCSEDDCIFFNKDIIVALYVDDGMILAREETKINQLLTRLSSSFDLNAINSHIFLGFQYHIDQDGSITLYQSSYIKNILDRYNMSDANPMDSPEVLNPVQNENNLLPLEGNIPYREAVGSLLYASVTTRIDIAHAVSKVAQNSKPRNLDWMAVKRIFRYLKGTVNLGIRFSPASPAEVIGYCDANFAGDKDDFKSTTGYVFTFAGGPIAWRSKKQDITTTSSTEAEFVALCAATKQAVWLKALTSSLSFTNGDPILIKCDNTSTISIAGNEKAAKRTRHLGAQIYYPKEQISKNNIIVKHVPSKDQLADMLTKPLGPQKFATNCNSLMSKVALTILSLATLCCTMSTGSRFDTVQPVIYSPVESYVEERVEHYEIDFTFIDPCRLIRESQKEFSINPNDTGTEWNSLIDRCESLFTDEWIRRIDILSKFHAERNHYLQKRGIIGDITLASGGFILGISTSNLLKSVFKSIGYRDPQDQRIQDLEWQAEAERVRIQAFERNFNLTRHINFELIRSLRDLNTAVMNNHREISRLANQQPIISWFISYVQFKITRAGQILDLIINQYNRQRIAVEPLKELMNMTFLDNVMDEDTVAKSIILKGKTTLTFKFSVRIRSNSTNVFRLITFKHWINIHDHPQLIKYDGPLYAIYNSRLECIRGIDEPQTRFIIDECNEPNYIDMHLKTWMNVTTLGSETMIQPIITVKTSSEFNYIYCYRSFITMNNKTYPCPPEVFKLMSTRSFKVGNFTHSASIRRLIMQQDSLPPFVDTIHPDHYTEQIFDSNKMINYITELKNNSEHAMRHYQDDLAMRQTRHLTYGAGTSLFTLTFLMILILLYRQSYVQTNRNHASPERPGSISPPNRLPPTAPQLQA